MRIHKRLLIAGSAAGTIAVVAVGIALATASSSAATPSKLTEDQVSQIALEFAAGTGDADPTSIEYVESSRQQAVSALFGDVVPSSEDSYAIVIRGQFVDNNAPRPSDTAAPTGSVLTLVIDATTGQLTDLGIQNQVPDLSRLGPVTTAR